MAIMGEYPTPEGEALGGLIWNHMIDNFGSGKLTSAFDGTIVECILKSPNGKISSRAENYKAYLAVQQGVEEYVDGYVDVTVSATGTGVGIFTQTNILEEDNALLNGTLELNSDAIFNVYAMPQVFNIGGSERGPDGYLDAVSGFFDTIVRCDGCRLGFPVDLYSLDVGNIRYQSLIAQPSQYQQLGLCAERH